ncbi:type 1 glutamine amidotransferase domain-containing protein [uncultured Massilia sp.]|uniref:type 1 glutamine amidotransferase domain-containing protein n=1 Tax=uncultured Massilia sp. TaxID=169973 RepID=UPI0025E37982|nr:type 1 glutamine amidotransferase domain-containing protein [uncultured Massilia sp.]
MNDPDKLAGKRIALLAADGFEQAELDAAAAALRQCGAAVTLVALRRGRIRGMHVHQSGELLRVDAAIDAVCCDDYDGLLIPGGYIGPDLLRQSAAARDFVRAFHAAGKPIAAMSHAALVLVSSGLAAGRLLTAWPGVRDDVVNAGATWLNQDTVRDGQLLTSRTPQDAGAFAREMVALFAGEPASAALPALPAPRASDPPRQIPSEAPEQPLRWLSAPSIGTMLSLALLGVGVVAANHRRRKEAGPSEGAGN